LYQGAELWDFSLVDPDNRRPVDYTLRSRLLHQVTPDWVSGGAKQAVIARFLALRRADPDLFRDGDVETLEVRGARAGHVLAFRRRLGDRGVSVAVMLRVAQAAHTLGQMPDAAWWGDTVVATGQGWRNAAGMFAGGAVHIEDWLRRAAPGRTPVANSPVFAMKSPT
jgi:(1->4)-alpha-D-glucan 1-alpha-D-glucosylmutase